MKYKHWLKIDGLTASEDIAEQFNQIERYLVKYPNSQATVFYYNSGAMHWIVCLECGQCYQELDLCIDNGLTYLRSLRAKPKNIGREKPFEFPAHYRKYEK